MHGLAASERARIDELRRQGSFFWTDVSLGETDRDELGATFGVQGPALESLVDFSVKTPPSRKFHADAELVVFSFSAFLESGLAEGSGMRGSARSRSTLRSAATIAYRSQRAGVAARGARPHHARRAKRAVHRLRDPRRDGRHRLRRVERDRARRSRGSS